MVCVTAGPIVSSGLATLCAVLMVDGGDVGAAVIIVIGLICCLGLPLLVLLPVGLAAGLDDTSSGVLTALGVLLPAGCVVQITNNFYTFGALTNEDDEGAGEIRIMMRSCLIPSLLLCATPMFVVAPIAMALDGEVRDWLFRAGLLSLGLLSVAVVPLLYFCCPVQMGAVVLTEGFIERTFLPVAVSPCLLLMVFAAAVGWGSGLTNLGQGVVMAGIFLSLVLLVYLAVGWGGGVIGESDGEGRVYMMMGLGCLSFLFTVIGVPVLFSVSMTGSQAGGLGFVVVTLALLTYVIPVLGAATSWMIQGAEVGLVDVTYPLTLAIYSCGIVPLALQLPMFLALDESWTTRCIILCANPSGLLLLLWLALKLLRSPLEDSMFVGRDRYRAIAGLVCLCLIVAAQVMFGFGLHGADQNSETVGAFGVLAVGVLPAALLCHLLTGAIVMWNDGIEFQGERERESSRLMLWIAQVVCCVAVPLVILLPVALAADISAPLKGALLATISGMAGIMVVFVLMALFVLTARHQPDLDMPGYAFIISSPFCFLHHVGIFLLFPVAVLIPYQCLADSDYFTNWMLGCDLVLYFTIATALLLGLQIQAMLKAILPNRPDNIVDLCGEWSILYLNQAFSDGECHALLVEELQLAFKNTCAVSADYLTLSHIVRGPCLMERSVSDGEELADVESIGAYLNANCILTQHESYGTRFKLTHQWMADHGGLCGTAPVVADSSTIEEGQDVIDCRRSLAETFNNTCHAFGLGTGNIWRVLALKAATSWSPRQTLFQFFIDVAQTERRATGDDNVSAVICARELHVLTRRLVGYSCLTTDEVEQTLTAGVWYKSGYLMFEDFLDRVLHEQPAARANAGNVNCLFSFLGFVLMLVDAIQFIALAVVSVSGWDDGHDLHQSFFEIFLFKFPHNWSDENFQLLFGLCCAIVLIVLICCALVTPYLHHKMVFPGTGLARDFVVLVMHLGCYTCYLPVVYTISLTWSCSSTASGTTMSGDSSETCLSAQQKGLATVGFFVVTVYHLVCVCIYPAVHWLAEHASSRRQQPLLLTGLANIKLFLVVTLAIVSTHHASPLFFLVSAIIALLSLIIFAWQLHPFEYTRAITTAIGLWACSCAIVAEQSSDSEYATRALQFGTLSLLGVLLFAIAWSDCKWLCMKAKTEPSALKRATSYIPSRALERLAVGERQLDITEAGTVQQGMAQQVADHLKIHRHDALALLRHHRFDKDAVFRACQADPEHAKTVLQRPDGLLKRVTSPFVTGNLFLTDSAEPDVSNSGENECLICCVEVAPDAMVSCQSRHRFCTDCLQRQIECQSEEDLTSISCPGFDIDSGQGCLELLPRKILAQYLSAEKLEKYDELNAKRFVEAAPEYQFCPFPDCKCVVQLSSEMKKRPTGPNGLTVECGNGHRWCWQCAWKRMAQGHTHLHHAPASCKAIAQMDSHVQLQENETDEATVRMLADSCKRCPFCQRLTHRFTGCPHMVCKPPGGCGGQFCWDCLRPWAGHNVARDHTPEILNEVAKQGRKDAYTMSEEDGGTLACHRIAAKRMLAALSLLKKLQTCLKDLTDEHTLWVLTEAIVVVQSCYYRDMCTRRLARLEASIYYIVQLLAKRSSIPLHPPAAEPIAAAAEDAAGVAAGVNHCEGLFSFLGRRGQPQNEWSNPLEPGNPTSVWKAGVFCEDVAESCNICLEGVSVRASNRDYVSNPLEFRFVLHPGVMFTPREAHISIRGLNPGASVHASVGLAPWSWTEMEKGSIEDVDFTLYGDAGLLDYYVPTRELQSAHVNWKYNHESTSSVAQLITTDVGACSVLKLVLSGQKLAQATFCSLEWFGVMQLPGLSLLPSQLTHFGDEESFKEYLLGVLKPGMPIRMAPGASFGLVPSGSSGVVLAVSSGFPQVLVWWYTLGYPHWAPLTALSLIHGAPEMCMRCSERTVIPPESLSCPVCGTPSVILANAIKTGVPIDHTGLDLALQQAAEAVVKKQPPVMHAYSCVMSRNTPQEPENMGMGMGDPATEADPAIEADPATQAALDPGQAVRLVGLSSKWNLQEGRVHNLEAESGKYLVDVYRRSSQSGASIGARVRASREHLEPVWEDRAEGAEVPDAAVDDVPIDIEPGPSGGNDDDLVMRI